MIESHPAYSGGIKPEASNAPTRALKAPLRAFPLSIDIDLPPFWGAAPIRRGINIPSHPEGCNSLSQPLLPPAFATWQGFRVKPIFKGEFKMKLDQINDKLGKCMDELSKAGYDHPDFEDEIWAYASEISDIRTRLYYLEKRIEKGPRRAPED